MKGKDSETRMAASSPDPCRRWTLHTRASTKRPSPLVSKVCRGKGPDPTRPHQIGVQDTTITDPCHRFPLGFVHFVFERSLGAIGAGEGETFSPHTYKKNPGNTLYTISYISCDGITTTTTTIDNDCIVYCSDCTTHGVYISNPSAQQRLESSPSLSPYKNAIF